MPDKDTKLDVKLLESIFQTSKKTIQEYIRELQRHCRFQSSYRHLNNGTVLDDRGRLIDLYDACVQQDAHLAGVLETLKSQIIGERYMLASQNEKGRYIKDVEETKKIQGIEFIVILSLLGNIPRKASRSTRNRRRKTRKSKSCHYLYSR